MFGYVSQPHQRSKRLTVLYKGGQYQHCGYDRYIGAADFPMRTVRPGTSTCRTARSTSFNKIKPELDKCVLLCANCHREQHARLKGILDLPPLSLSPDRAEVLN
jgi:hypothetical protein